MATISVTRARARTYLSAMPGLQPSSRGLGPDRGVELLIEHEKGAGVWSGEYVGATRHEAPERRKSPR